MASLPSYWRQVGQPGRNAKRLESRESKRADKASGLPKIGASDGGARPMGQVALLPAVVEFYREQLQTEAVRNRSGCLELTRHDEAILNRMISGRKRNAGQYLCRSFIEVIPEQPSQFRPGSRHGPHPFCP